MKRRFVSEEAMGLPRGGNYNGRYEAAEFKVT